MSKTKTIAEIAVGIALAVICSFLKIYEMPQGGSVALTMVPILFIAQKHGPLAGCITGGIYGLLSAILSGMIYHPLSILLDYIIAFGVLGVAGFFKNSLPKIIVGSILGVLGRFISSFVSGAVLFASYAPVGQNPWVYSLIYQATYLVPEMLISIAVLTLLYKKAHRLYNKF